MTKGRSFTEGCTFIAVVLVVTACLIWGFLFVAEMASIW